MHPDVGIVEGFGIRAALKLKGLRDDVARVSVCGPLIGWEDLPFGGDAVDGDLDAFDCGFGLVVEGEVKSQGWSVLLSVACGEDLGRGLAVRAEADGTFGSHGDAPEYDGGVGAGDGGRLREQGCCGEEQESDVEAVHRNLPVLLYVANQNVTLLTVASSSGERKMSGMRASGAIASCLLQRVARSGRR